MNEINVWQVSSAAHFNIYIYIHKQTSTCMPTLQKIEYKKKQNINSTQLKPYGQNKNYLYIHVIRRKRFNNWGAWVNKWVSECVYDVENIEFNLFFFFYYLHIHIFFFFLSIVFVLSSLPHIYTMLKTQLYDHRT